MKRTLQLLSILFVATLLLAQTHTSAVLDVAQTWTAVQTFSSNITAPNIVYSDALAPATLTDAAPVAWDVGSNPANNAKVTFTVHSGSRTLNVANMVTGGTYVLVMVQDGTGGENLTGGTGCTWKQLGGGGGTFTLTATAAAIDVLTFYYDGTNCYANLGKAYN
jgi:hypothetical protein